jgi:SNF2 family DNA or RNA helicase
MKFRYALAGMPFGRHPENLWSQFYALDYGETLGELGIFRGAFFKAQRNYFSGFDEWVFDKSKIDELSRVLRHSSIRYDKDECLDLPDKTPVAVTVHFSDETWAYYERLIEELSAAQGNFKLVDNVFGRMRQLVAGYMTVTDPEGARQTVVFKNNPKLESMLEKLDELEGEKLIIYCDYRKSIEIVSEALKKKKVKHVILVGGAKDKPKIIKQFDDPKIQVLLMTQAGSMGLNLQKHCRYLFFFESPVDPIIRSQTIDRIHRLGQTRRVFVYDFIVKGSVDVKIQKYIAEGKNLFDSLMGNRSAGPTVDG